MAVLDRLHHVGIVTEDLDGSRDFYMSVLGLHEGPRNAFRNPGSWLYLGDTPIVHIITNVPRPSGPTGKFDHFCLAATGYDDWRARLTDKGVTFQTDGQPGGIRQLFFKDPNGVSIELNFSGV